MRVARSQRAATVLMGTVAALALFADFVEAVKVSAPAKQV